MATYDELRSLFNNDSLRNRVTTATVIAAQAQLDASPGSVNGRAWALKVLRSPEEWGSVVLKTVLAANSAGSVAQISAATDAAIQTNVSDVVVSLIAADSGL